MIQLKSYFWCTYLFLKKMPWYFYATTTCESEIYLTKQEYLNQYFVLTAPERCILIFSQCFILRRDLVANNFVINNSSNRSVHIPISPEVIKYNYYLLWTDILDSKFHCFACAVSYLWGWSAFSEIHPVFLALHFVSFQICNFKHAFILETLGRFTKLTPVLYNDSYIIELSCSYLLCCGLREQ